MQIGHRHPCANVAVVVAASAVVASVLAALVVAAVLAESTAGEIAALGVVPPLSGLVFRRLSADPL